MVQQQDVRDALEQETTTSHLKADKPHSYTTRRARHRVSVLVLLRAVLLLALCQATMGMTGFDASNLSTASPGPVPAGNHSAMITSWNRTAAAMPYPDMQWQHAVPQHSVTSVAEPESALQRHVAKPMKLEYVMSQEDALEAAKQACAGGKMQACFLQYGFGNLHQQQPVQQQQWYEKLLGIFASIDLPSIPGLQDFLVRNWVLLCCVALVLYMLTIVGVIWYCIGRWDREDTSDWQNLENLRTLAEDLQQVKAQMPPVAAAEPMLPQLYPSQAQVHLRTSGLASQQQTTRTQVTLTASSHTSPQSVPQQQQRAPHSNRSAPKTSAWQNFKQQHAQHIELCMLLFLCVLLSMLSNAGLLYVIMAQLDVWLHISGLVAKAFHPLGSITATCSQQAATMAAHMATAVKAMASSSQLAAKLWAFIKPCLLALWQLATWFMLVVHPRLPGVWQLTVKVLTMVTPALQWLGRHVGHLYRLIWARLRRKKEIDIWIGQPGWLKGTFVGDSLVPVEAGWWLAGGFSDTDEQETNDGATGNVRAGTADGKQPVGTSQAAAESANKSKQDSLCWATAKQQPQRQPQRRRRPHFDFSVSRCRVLQREVYSEPAPAKPWWMTRQPAPGAQFVQAARIVTGNPNAMPEYGNFVPSSSQGAQLQSGPATAQQHGAAVVSWAAMCRQAEERSIATKQSFFSSANASPDWATICRQAAERSAAAKQSFTLPGTVSPDWATLRRQAVQRSMATQHSFASLGVATSEWSAICERVRRRSLAAAESLMSSGFPQTQQHTTLPSQPMAPPFAAAAPPAAAAAQSTSVFARLGASRQQTAPVSNPVAAKLAGAAPQMPAQMSAFAHLGAATAAVPAQRPPLQTATSTEAMAVDSESEMEVDAAVSSAASHGVMHNQTHAANGSLFGAFAGYSARQAGVNMASNPVAGVNMAGNPMAGVNMAGNPMAAPFSSIRSGAATFGMQSSMAAPTHQAMFSGPSMTQASSANQVYPSPQTGLRIKLPDRSQLNSTPFGSLQRPLTHLQSMRAQSMSQPGQSSTAGNAPQLQSMRPQSMSQASPSNPALNAFQVTRTKRTFSFYPPAAAPPTPAAFSAVQGSRADQAAMPPSPPRFPAPSGAMPPPLPRFPAPAGAMPSPPPWVPANRGGMGAHSAVTPPQQTRIPPPGAAITSPAVMPPPPARFSASRRVTPGQTEMPPPPPRPQGSPAARPRSADMPPPPPRMPTPNRGRPQGTAGAPPPLWGAFATGARSPRQRPNAMSASQSQASGSSSVSNDRNAMPSPPPQFRRSSGVRPGSAEMPSLSGLHL